MAAPAMSKDLLAHTLKVYNDVGKSKIEAAKVLGISETSVRQRLKKAKAAGLVPKVGGTVGGIKTRKMRGPRRGQVKRYIITSAQNNTHVHQPAWLNIQAMADHYDAEILVGTYSYDVEAYGEQAVKRGKSKRLHGELHTRQNWYDPELEPFFSDERLELAPGLVWCGEGNTLPTAQNPLAGFETYNGRSSNIYPHAKHALRSIASGKYEGTKFNYTTGVVTQKNYIQKRAGILAEFHHMYGGLVVEVDSGGDWFVRQLCLGPDDAIHDLDLKAEGGNVTSGNPVAAITWGDIHRERIDPDVRRLGWSKGGVLDFLRPGTQFFHDTVDFYRRNHHEVGNPHKMFERFVYGQESVDREMDDAADFLGNEAYRSFCRSVVVPSNHDEAFERWLRDADYRKDPVNALFFLRSQLAMYEAISRRDGNYLLFEDVMRKKGVPADVQFLRRDESFITCKEFDGGIEHGMHGDKGPGGARGTLQNFSKYGRRSTIAHGHGAGIKDGCHQVGTSSLLDLRYNVGPGHWSHSHGLDYPNGTRTIYTMYKGKPWAEREGFELRRA